MSKDIKHFKGRGEDDSWESLAKDLFGVEPASADDLGDLDVEPFRPVGGESSEAEESSPAAELPMEPRFEDRPPATGEQDVRSLEPEPPAYREAARFDPEVRAEGFDVDDFGAGLGIDLPPEEPRTVPDSSRAPERGSRSERAERPRPPEPPRERAERPESRPERPRAERSAEPPRSEPEGERDTYWDALDSVSSWDDKGSGRPADEPAEPPRVDRGRRGGRDQGRGERGGRPRRGERESGYGNRDRGGRGESRGDLPPREPRPPLDEPVRQDEPRTERQPESHSGRRPASRRDREEGEPRRRDREPRGRGPGRDVGRVPPATFDEETGFGAGLADERVPDELEATDVTPLESSVSPEREDPRRGRRRRRRPEGRAFEPIDEPLDVAPASEIEPDLDEAAEVPERRPRGRDRGGRRSRYGEPRRPEPARAAEPEFVDDEPVPVAGWDSDSEDDDLDGEPAVSYQDLPTWEEAISYLLPRPESRSDIASERPRSSGPREGFRGEGPRGRGGRGGRRRR